MLSGVQAPLDHYYWPGLPRWREELTRTSYSLHSCLLDVSSKGNNLFSVRFCTKHCPRRHAVAAIGCFLKNTFCHRQPQVLLRFIQLKSEQIRGLYSPITSFICHIYPIWCAMICCYLKLCLIHWGCILCLISLTSFRNCNFFSSSWGLYTLLRPQWTICVSC